MPGVEPGSQAWEACMIPLHYMRSAHPLLDYGCPQTDTLQSPQLALSKLLGATAFHFKAVGASGPAGADDLTGKARRRPGCPGAAVTPMRRRWHTGPLGRQARCPPPRAPSMAGGHHPRKMRMPGVEPGSQAWEACMIPLHYMRSAHPLLDYGRPHTNTLQSPQLALSRPRASRLRLPPGQQGQTT